MEHIIIRQATSADIPTLLRFEQGVISAERPFDNTLGEGIIHYYNLEEMIAAPYIELLVAEVNGEPVSSGYARIEKAKQFYKHKHHAYLGFMYTEPKYRGKGINQKIIETLTQWAASQHITELMLEVYCGNSPAIKAYEKAGFSSNMVQMRMPVQIPE